MVCRLSLTDVGGGAPRRHPSEVALARVLTGAFARNAAAAKPQFRVTYAGPSGPAFVILGGWLVWTRTARVVSGHTLKHVVAAGATWFVLDMLKKRGRAPLPLTDALAHAEDGGPPPSYP